MDKHEAEQLVERIETDAAKVIVVLGIEPFGTVSNPSYATDFFVKCACKATGLRFAVKSLEHWEDLKQHVLVRICRFVYRLMKSQKNGKMST